MVRSDKSAIEYFTGSEGLSAPAGMVTFRRPEKARAWSEPGLILLESGDTGRAMCADAICSGAEPYRLEQAQPQFPTADCEMNDLSQSRVRGSSAKREFPGSTSCCDAAQEPTQFCCDSTAMPAALRMTETTTSRRILLASLININIRENPLRILYLSPRGYCIDNRLRTASGTETATKHLARFIGNQPLSVLQRQDFYVIQQVDLQRHPASHRYELHLLGAGANPRMRCRSEESALGSLPGSSISARHSSTVLIVHRHSELRFPVTQVEVFEHRSRTSRLLR